MLKNNWRVGRFARDLSRKEFEKEYPLDNEELAAQRSREGKQRLADTARREAIENIKNQTTSELFRLQSNEVLAARALLSVAGDKEYQVRLYLEAALVLFKYDLMGATVIRGAIRALDSL